MIDWWQGTDGHSNFGDPGNGIWNITPDYGSGDWFHVYAFTMTMGIILAVLFSAWKFYRKGIPLTQLAIGVVIIVPCSLFGASVFGKLNGDGLGKNLEGCSTAGLFAFWHAGMAIHGGVYVGTAVGVITFGIMGHFTKVSLWTYMDCIIPNILLGQGLGRWGNFFNHEVVGAPIGIYSATSHPLSWLPDYIQRNTVFVYNGPIDGVHNVINGLTLQDGVAYQMTPIFLIESCALLIGWGLITFVIPNFGKWFGPKPWKKHSDLFKLNWKQTLINVFMFWKVPSNPKIDEMTRKFYENDNQPSYDNQPAWAQSWFVIWKQAYEYNPDFNERDEYHQIVKDTQSSNYSLTKKRFKMGRALRKANNPDGYWTTKVGAEACAYFLIWNVVRFALELQRPYDHLFVMYEKTLSLCLIGITGLIGLLGMILTQTVAADFFRQPGYLYEKEYFRDEPINKHWWTTSKRLLSEQMSREQFRPINKDPIIKEDINEDQKILEKQRKAQEKLARLEAKQNKKKNK